MTHQLIALSLKRKEGVLERLPGVLVAHVTLEVGRRELRELEFAEIKRMTPLATLSRH